VCRRKLLWGKIRKKVKFADGWGGLKRIIKERYGINVLVWVKRGGGGSASLESISE